MLGEQRGAHAHAASPPPKAAFPYSHAGDLEQALLGEPGPMVAMTPGGRRSRSATPNGSSPPAPRSPHLGPLPSPRAPTPGGLGGPGAVPLSPDYIAAMTESMALTRRDRKQRLALSEALTSRPLTPLPPRHPWCAALIRATCTLSGRPRLCAHRLLLLGLSSALPRY
jgi:hypothetical protein